MDEKTATHLLGKQRVYQAILNNPQPEKCSLCTKGIVATHIMVLKGVQVKTCDKCRDRLVKEGWTEK